jgi:hypothetical protein
MVEVEAVHLGTNDVVVDLLRNRPRRRIDRFEAPSVRGELTLLRRHRPCAIVRARRSRAWAVETRASL